MSYWANCPALGNFSGKALSTIYMTNFTPVRSVYETTFFKS